jgi:Fe-S-cluster-containing dehydrogenase component
MGKHKLWQSIEEVHGEAHEPNAPEPLLEQPFSRRRFMALLSASMALAAGSAGCRRPDHKLVPAVAAPEYQIPGLPLFYTTTFQHKNAAFGLLVKCREGRPIKIEGNNLHPISGGASTAYAQASLLTLYDPDRIRRVRMGNALRVPLETALTRLAETLKEEAAAGRLCYLCIEEHCSPSYEALLKALQADLPWLRVVFMPSFLAEHAAALNAQVLGIDGEIVPNLERADLIVTVEADPLGIDRYALWHTRNFAARRRVRSRQEARMNRLVAIEAIMSLTGTNADTRLRMHPAAFEGFLAAVLRELARHRPVPSVLVNAAAQLPAAYAEQAAQLAEELHRAGERAAVLVGGHLGEPLHALALAINLALGSVGQGRVFDPAYVLPNSHRKQPELERFREDLRAGKVGAVLFANVNPEYTADVELRQLLARVGRKAALSLYHDETAQSCWIHIPVAHPLESWGDALAVDGTLSVQQPLIAPLNEGIGSLQDVLLQLAKVLAPERWSEVESYYDFVRQHWRTTYGVDDQQWEQILREGIYRVQRPVPPLRVDLNALARAIRPSGLDRSRLLLLALPSYALYDGTYANCGWLQELPDPITKLTWDNVAAISSGTAHQLGLRSGDLVRLQQEDGATIELPVWVQPGMADGVVLTNLGYGRTAGGEVLRNVGQNAYPLLRSGHLGYTAVQLTPLERRYPLATTQRYYRLQGRPIVQLASLEEYTRPEGPQFHSPEFPGYPGPDGRRIPLTIVPPYEYKGHRWWMVVDLSACTGCGACVVACQAENNIPVVGKEQVLRGREMHWIRIDRYYVGSVENPRVVHQPMLCQHCENAPCENVCPVAATTHSPEGLNEMTYNRCVGTRYCLNNCPYKVRRFNFLNYHTDQRPPLEMLFNPDVTVRMRGVMEKCTFCVQRINEAKYHAKDEGRSRVRDGEVLTACQQACPAGAILFGDANDPESRVSQLRRSDRAFSVLEELNVRPSITYLAKLWNAPVEQVHQLRES